MRRHDAASDGRQHGRRSGQSWGRLVLALLWMGLPIALANLLVTQLAPRVLGVGGQPDAGTGALVSERPAEWPMLILEAAPAVRTLAAAPPGQAAPEPPRDAPAFGAPPAAGRAGAGTDTDARVEAALRGLTTDAERVGQLFLAGWLGSTAEEARATLRDLRPGGIVFVQNTRAAADARAINEALTRMARELGMPPLLLAVDHEGGRVQRIADVTNLGANVEFAASGPSEREACERGLFHARQLRAMGFNMNLAPVLDVNNNPANPVIGSRSYGAEPALVARLGAAYVRGLQSGGVIAVGKHFPGHGNTAVDSHLQLPVLPQSEAQLEAVELVPFRRAIAGDTDVAAIMSAHIVFPAVDPSGAPATLSAPIMTGLLRERLGFRGLSVSDDLANMRAITDHFTPGQAALRSVVAGVDLLIIAGDLARQRESRDALLAGLGSGELTRERLDEAVRRVLLTKARFGLLGETALVDGCH